VNDMIMRAEPDQTLLVSGQIPNLGKEVGEIRSTNSPCHRLWVDEWCWSSWCGHNEALCQVWDAYSFRKDTTGAILASVETHGTSYC